ncbi:MAG: accessory factor UbiK family protein [Alphaproteobacteria bacterium]|jgi:BMFP domain-containing protein YqiC
MQTRNRIFDDAAKLAGGAIGTLEGVRREIEGLVRQQVERILSRFDLVTRDEFDAVKEMAARARAEQEELAQRLETLEASQAKPTVDKSMSTRKTPKSKKT